MRAMRCPQGEVGNPWSDTTSYEEPAVAKRRQHLMVCVYFWVTGDK